MTREEIENMRRVDILLRPVAQTERGIDAWKYFLASGLAFAYLDDRKETHDFVLSQMQKILKCKDEPRATFDDVDVGETIAQLIPELQKMDMKPEDLGEALVRNAVYLAEKYQEGGYVSVDTCWTAFKIGLSYKGLFQADKIVLIDPINPKDRKSVELDGGGRKIRLPLANEL